MIVYVGPVVTRFSSTIGKDRAAVPSAFWKVVVDPERDEAIGFVMPNEPVRKNEVGKKFEQPIQAIEAEAGNGEVQRDFLRLIMAGGE